MEVQCKVSKGWSAYSALQPSHAAGNQSGVLLSGASLGSVRRAITPRSGHLYGRSVVWCAIEVFYRLANLGHPSIQTIQELVIPERAARPHPPNAPMSDPAVSRRSAQISQSLPLCAIEHHRIGPESHHVLGKRFWGFHGLDRISLIKQMQELFRLNGGSLQGSGGKSA